MIKKTVSLVSLFVIYSSIIVAEENVVDQAQNIQVEFNAIADDAAAKLLEDKDIIGKKKDEALKLLEQLKIKDSEIAKVISDPEISEQKKCDLIKKAKKMKDKIHKLIRKKDKKSKKDEE